MERQYNEREKNESENYVSEYQANFLEKEPIPSIEWTFDVFKKMLPLVSVEDTNGLIAKYLKEDNRVVILTGPEKDGLVKPTEQEVLNSLTVNKNELTAYTETKVSESLLRNPVKEGSVVSKQSNAKLGTTTLKLSNGATVVYKKTDFKNDQVMFEAVSFGGPICLLTMKWLKFH